MELKCQLNWNIADFVKWATKLTPCKQLESPVNHFTFPDLDKTLKFYLRVTATGGLIEIYLVNKNADRINGKVLICLLNQEGQIWRQRSSVISLVVGASNRLDNFVTQYELSGSPARLPNGCLSIQCTVTITQPIFRQPKGKGRKRCHEECFGQETMKKLMSDTAFADFEIVCEGNTFPCHRHVLAIRSTVLAEMMKTEKWIEGKKNSLEIKDFDQETVQTALHFVYCGEFPEGSKCITDLLLFADKYNIEKMVNVCQAELSDILDVNNVLSILEVANLISGADPLKDDCVSFVAKNVKTLKKTPDWKNFENPELLKAVLERVVDERN